MSASEFNINPVRLTDGSKVYDVVAFDGNHRVTIACLDEAAARRIRDALNGDDVVSFDIDSFGSAV